MDTREINPWRVVVDLTRAGRACASSARAGRWRDASLGKKRGLIVGLTVGCSNLSQPIHVLNGGPRMRYQSESSSLENPLRTEMLSERNKVRRTELTIGSCSSRRFMSCRRTSSSIFSSSCLEAREASSDGLAAGSAWEAICFLQKSERLSIKVKGADDATSASDATAASLSCRCVSDAAMQRMRSCAAKKCSVPPVSFSVRHRPAERGPPSHATATGRERGRMR